jgi:hypothetical protein
MSIESRVHDQPQSTLSSRSVFSACSAVSAVIGVFWHSTPSRSRAAADPVVSVGRRVTSVDVGVVDAASRRLSIWVRPTQGTN